MKLFEVFDKDSSVEDWDHRSYGNMGEVHYTEIDGKTVHVEFVNLPDLLTYYETMESHGMVADAEMTYDSTIEEVPELKEWNSIINVGFGVDGSPERQNWSNPRKVYELLSSIVHLVLKHSEENNGKKYVFGSIDHKKALLFYRMIRKYTKNVYLAKNPEGSNGHTFVFAHS